MYRNNITPSSSHHRGPSVLREFQVSILPYSLGILLILIGVYISFWNERQTVHKAQSLSEGYRKILVPETIDVVFEENKDKLLLIAGPLNIPDKLEDETYGISIQAIRLKKRVQMYQWYEVEDEVLIDEHKHTTYSYDKDWFDYPLDSNSFDSPMGHHNPETWPLNSSEIINYRVKIGGFLLGKDLRDKFDSEFTSFTSDERPHPYSGIKMHGGLYFHSQDVWSPDVGDLRIQFSYAGKHGDIFTVVGKQCGREIRPYKTEETSAELLFLHKGIKKPEQVFQIEQNQNFFQNWCLRFLGWLITFLGYFSIESLLNVLVERHSGVRRYLVFGLSNIPISFSFSTSLVSIGLAWLLYKPYFGLLLCLFSLSPITLSICQNYLSRDNSRRRI